MWPKVEIIYAPKRKGLSFSDIEIRHLLVATAVLILAFTLSLWWLGNGWPLEFAFASAVLAVGTGFILHEMAHKFVAQRFKCWAEFRYNPFGLLITIASSIMGFLMAAPGAVYISGDVTRSENGKISLAGPLTNLAIGGLTLPIALWIIPDFAGLLLFVAYINLFLGVFNMLPVPPLDGSKIYQWNLLIYIGTFAGLIALIIPVYLLMTTGRLPF